MRCETVLLPEVPALATPEQIDRLLALSMSPYSLGQANSLHYRFEDEDAPGALKGTALHVLGPYEVVSLNGTVSMRLAAEASVTWPNEQESCPLTEDLAVAAETYLQAKIEALRGAEEWSAQEIMFRMQLGSPHLQ